MTSRPPIHLNIHLPELSPTQANFLWEVLSDLTAALWNAYADDLVQIEQQRLHLLDLEEHCCAPEDDFDDDPEDAPDAPELDAPASPLATKQEPDLNL